MHETIYEMSASLFVIIWMHQTGCCTNGMMIVTAKNKIENKLTKKKRKQEIRPQIKNTILHFSISSENKSKCNKTDWNFY